MPDDIQPGDSLADVLRVALSMEIQRDLAGPESAQGIPDAEKTGVKSPPGGIIYAAWRQYGGWLLLVVGTSPAWLSAGIIALALALKRWH